MSNNTHYVKNQPRGFINKIQNVAIVGPSGQMASHIIVELVKNPQFKITALTRKGGKSVDQISKGVHTIKEVDYKDNNSIVEALQNQDVLIVTLAVNAPQELPKRLADAAIEAGVRWYIPNHWGYELQEHVERNPVSKARDQHYQYLEQKGLPFTPLSCGFWYEWSLSGGMEMYGIDTKQRKANLYENGKSTLITSTWVQSAKAIAAFLNLPIYPNDENDQTLTMSNWHNRHLHVYSFRLNQRQMLDVVEKVTQTNDSQWDIQNVDVKKVYDDGMERFRNGDPLGYRICIYSRMFFPDQPGDLQEDCSRDMKLLGLKADESLEEATKVAVKMQQEDYLQQFLQKRFAAQ